MTRTANCKLHREGLKRPHECSTVTSGEREDYP